MTDNLSHLLNAPPAQQAAPQNQPPAYPMQGQPQPQYQQYPPQPQAPPVQQAYPPQPQYAPQPQPQAPPVPQGYPPQQQPQYPPQQAAQQQNQRVPLEGGMAQYAQAAQGLFNDVSHNAPRIYFDCEGTYVVELTRLTTGRSTNPKTTGRKYLAANFKILRTDFCATDPAHTQVRDGVEVSWMTWLPQDPNYMTLSDKFNLADALTLGSAIVGLKAADPNNNPYIDLRIIDQMCVDDGAIAKGKIFGVTVVGKPDKNNPQRIYYNARFHAVDAQWNRTDGLTPQELQARNAGG